MKRLSALAINLAASLTLFTAAVDVVLGTEIGLNPQTTPNTSGELDNFRRSATNGDGRGKDLWVVNNDRPE